MSQRTTRKVASHVIFGYPLQDLPTTELPTRLQIGRHVLFLKEHKSSSNKDIIPQLSQNVIDLWIRAGIPPQPLKNVKVKMTRLMEEGSKASKHGASVEKSRQFMEGLNKLFDIAACQCNDILACDCTKEQKIPARERDFLADQRTVRRMQIGGVDKAVTKMLKKRSARTSRMEERVSEEKKRKIEHEYSVPLAADNMAESTSSSEREETEETNDDWRALEVQRNTKPIPTVALEAERFGVSNRGAAAIATAALIDYGVVSVSDKTNIIDPKKIWRAREHLRERLKKTAEENEEEIVAVFFDGRRDSTLVKEKKNNKWYSRKIIEDHYVLVAEPGTSYLQHITVERGTGQGIANGLYEAISEIGIAESLTAVGADSTPVNTGAKGGAIHLLELLLNRPLQWLICSLHLNELPLRHLCKHLIGPSEGPSQWKGPIGKALTTCETLPLVNFQKISGDPLPVVDLDDISRDQGYLYRIITAIITGVVTEDLIREKPGDMSMARWVTTASRICRLYIATAQPTAELCSLAKFVVVSYGPMWFRIKCEHRCSDGPKHLLQQIKIQKLLPPVVAGITWSVIKRNSYWAHEENVLLAMLADGNEENRKTAVDTIKSIRQHPGTSKTQIREFRSPNITESCQTLKDLLPPVDQCKFEPPMTTKLSNEDLDSFLQHPYEINIPCHSQGVERCVKLVTEASSTVYGRDARDGYIRAVVRSRQCMPSFESKQDFSAPALD